jgi:hypothetical protein
MELQVSSQLSREHATDVSSYSSPEESGENQEAPQSGYPVTRISLKTSTLLQSYRYRKRL